MKILAVSVVSVVTLGIHYGWVVEPFLGGAHWVHAIHGRLCYIPIVMAASWFGLRGGLVAAAAISALVLPYVFLYVEGAHDFVGETTEIFFYFAIGGLVGLLFDRENRAREREQEAQLRAERTHRLSMAGQIAAGVAHEIKNPLASIKGAADILTDDGTSREEREEFKNILRNEVKRIDGTVAEFLAYARPRETRLEKLDLTDTIRTVLRQIESSAARAGIGITNSLDNDVVVNGDAEQIRQVALNLLLNAIQASAAGKTITVRLAAPGRARAVLTVTDSGSGIAPELLDRVFDPFVTSKPDGTGLGLAVARDIVDGHGGRIDIASIKDGGTTVTVDLPLYGEERVR